MKFFKDLIASILIVASVAVILAAFVAVAGIALTVIAIFIVIFSVGRILGAHDRLRSAIEAVTR